MEHGRFSSILGNNKYSHIGLVIWLEIPNQTWIYSNRSIKKQGFVTKALHHTFYETSLYLYVWVSLKQPN